MQTLKKRTSEHTPAHAGGGFSFALHPDTVQGFLFARMQHSPMQAFTTCFAVSMQFYTAHAEKQRTGLYRGFSCNCTRSTAHDTRPTQAAIIQPATRWKTYTRPDALNRYQIPPPHRDAVQVSTAAYYNKVYKRADHASSGGSASPPVQGQPGGVSILYTPSGLQSGTGSAVNQGGAVWHPPPGGAVQQQGRGGRRGTTGGYRRSSFRAVAR